MRESEIIALFPIEPEPLRDDCGQIDARTIVTTDSLSEGTHFRLDWSGPEDLACKLWNVNASDLAASGGTPEWCLLNLGLPADIADDWIRAFAAALRSELRSAGARLIGGDTYRAQTLQLTLTLGGSLSGTSGASAWLRRDGARAGDAIYITGTPGLAELGYELLCDSAIGTPPEIRGHADPLIRTAVQRHLRPQARAALAAQLCQSSTLRPSAMMDLSDGLYIDLGRLAAANPGLHFALDYDALPLFEIPAESQLQLDADRRQLLALTSGEELELLFTADPARAAELHAAGVDCTIVGRVLPGNSSVTSQGGGLTLENAPWPAPPRPGFEHF